jgi:hypothetical protein
LLKTEAGDGRQEGTHRRLGEVVRPYGLITLMPRACAIRSAWPVPPLRELSSVRLPSGVQQITTHAGWSRPAPSTW